MMMMIMKKMLEFMLFFIVIFMGIWWKRVKNWKMWPRAVKHRSVGVLWHRLYLLMVTQSALGWRLSGKLGPLPFCWHWLVGDGSLRVAVSEVSLIIALEAAVGERHPKERARTRNNCTYCI